ncbi:MAG: ATP-binding cassette domain-containing protein [Bacilli bacterium]
MIKLKNIDYKIDNKYILNNINLDINDGDFVCISGPNGSGKSSLAKVIMGIYKESTGSIFLDSNDITLLNVDERANAGITFTFQSPIVFNGIKVSDILNLSSGRVLSTEESNEILNEVGLETNKYISRLLDKDLSGGEIKRIELASAIARKSRLIIFDEPEAGIDLWSFKDLLKIFKKLKKDKKLSVIVISHQKQIIELGSRVLIMNNGKINEINKNEVSKLFESEE